MAPLTTALLTTALPTMAPLTMAPLTTALLTAALLTAALLTAALLTMALPTMALLITASTHYGNAEDGTTYTVSGPLHSGLPTNEFVKSTLVSRPEIRPLTLVLKQAAVTPSPIRTRIHPHSSSG